MQDMGERLDASALLANESRRLRDRSATLRTYSARLQASAAFTRDQLRATILRYGLCGAPPIRGGSDADADDRRRALIRTIAARSPCAHSSGRSSGARCMLCEGTIPEGAQQVEIDAGRTIIVDETCYTSFLKDIVE